VTAGTAIATPVSQALTPSEEIVTDLEIVIPTGHVGLTGIAIFYASRQVIPFDTGDWITANGDVIHWPLSDFPTGGQWVAKAYNTDVYDHSFYLRWLVNDLPDPPVPPQLALANIVGASLGGSIETITTNGEET
jgi:hypothetical protein